ncbi:MAG: hypothetical protein EOP06_17500 [Proteobacteria bacterium]|nr:MAG: hypothetical protein EOP06_17500 [Pseudomonadota bacterium]
MLAEPPVTGKVLVPVLAGGGGSGKSTVLNMFSTDADAIFDTTFSYPEYAERLHNQILASGRKMEVLYIHRQFDKAFENIIGRFLKGKATGDPRIVPLPVAASAHAGAQDLILNLKNIPIKVFDNNRSIDEIGEISLGQLTDQSYDRQHEPGRDESENRSEETEGSPRKGDERTGGNRGDQSRSETQARLEAEGRAILRLHREEGLLTDEEVSAFLAE